jgi:hypothetical protein
LDNATLAKIKKLFALARDAGATEAEAALAAEKAAGLLVEHKLSMADIEGYDPDEDEPVTDSGTMQRERRRPWCDVLIGCVAATCNCRVVIHGEQTYRIIGRETDVAVTMETFRFLVAQVQRLAAQSVCVGRSQYAAFRRGCSDRICERLDEVHERQDTHEESRAIVVRDDAAVEAFMAKRYPKLESRRRARPIWTSESVEAYHAGFRAGDDVALGGRAIEREQEQLASGATA